MRYRELLAEVMLHDLMCGVAGADEGATQAFDGVSAALSDLAAAALEAALAVARATLIAGVSGPPVSRERIAATRLSVVAMGKCGARELNVVSDVDVIFVAEAAPPPGGTESPDTGLDTEAMLRIATRLATEPLCVRFTTRRSSRRCGRSIRTFGPRANRVPWCVRSVQVLN